MLAIWLWLGRGLGGRLARVRYDILRGTFLVSGQWIYIRKWMAAKRVIVLGVNVSRYSLSLSSVKLCVTAPAFWALNEEVALGAMANCCGDQWRWCVLQVSRNALYLLSYQLRQSHRKGRRKYYQLRQLVYDLHQRKPAAKSQTCLASQHAQKVEKPVESTFPPLFRNFSHVLSRDHVQDLFRCKTLLLFIQ